MTQIRKIKGIAGELPSEEKYYGEYPIRTPEEVEEEMRVQGYNECRGDVLNTDLDPNECACVDVEKAKEILPDLIDRHFSKGECEKRGNAIVLGAEILIELAISNCLKWREDE